MADYLSTTEENIATTITRTLMSAQPLGAICAIDSVSTAIDRVSTAIDSVNTSILLTRTIALSA